MNCFALSTQVACAMDGAGSAVAGAIPAAPANALPGANIAVAAVDPGAAALALMGGMGDPAAGRVAQLEDHRRDLQGQRRALMKERTDVQKMIKNEKKKRQRIMEKAKGLSDADLMSVIAARAAQAKAAPKAKGKANAKAKAKS